MNNMYMAQCGVCCSLSNSFTVMHECGGPAPCVPTHSVCTTCFQAWAASRPYSNDTPMLCMYGCRIVVDPPRVLNLPINHAPLLGPNQQHRIYAVYPAEGDTPLYEVVAEPIDERLPMPPTGPTEEDDREQLLAKIHAYQLRLQEMEARIQTMQAQQQARDQIVYQQMYVILATMRLTAASGGM